MAYASKDSRIKVFSRPWYIKKGANRCRNYGFELSNGEFIQWFDSDDLMSFNMIEEKLSAFVSTQFDMVVCGASFFSRIIEIRASEKNKSIEPITNNPAFEYFSGNFWFGTPQAIFRRGVIASLPYIFNSKLKRNQETELYVRLLLNDLNISHINESLVFIRLHDDSISGKYSVMSSENKIFLDLDAYISMFLAFRIGNKLSEEVLNYFSNYFFRCLRKMKIGILKFTELYIFGMRYNLFPSRLLATKIFLRRILFNV
jgi:glycosyltransferase involved in cell wall biosynthesis